MVSASFAINSSASYTQVITWLKGKEYSLEDTNWGQTESLFAAEMRKFPLIETLRTSRERVSASFGPDFCASLTMIKFQLDFKISKAETLTKLRDLSVWYETQVGQIWSPAGFLGDLKHRSGGAVRAAVAVRNLRVHLFKQVGSPQLQGTSSHARWLLATIHAQRRVFLACFAQQGPSRAKRRPRAAKKWHC
jgi:hypothetical protein